jgi:acyl-homoserine-lactone acylase
VVGYAPGKDGLYRSIGGDSYVAAVEFSTPLRARALLSYGNSSQPDSIHRGDQLALFAKKELRPVWRTRAEIEANLESREVLK